MDDDALLRQTIRRCTAVLVATIGITGWTLMGERQAGPPLLLAFGAIVYLAAQYMDLTPTQAGTDKDSSKSAPAENSGNNP
ncbi:hypothetical protein ACFR9U_06355 [Halorientalis brevis]|uniref:DUF2892 domain-containing protein n=1 Tax=Halorientalis brevis TaxID=1126241 RepID=A0ABD6C9K2_9EURY|nr:hypothetical protein [Halorientalis brevis]